MLLSESRASGAPIQHAVGAEGGALQRQEDRAILVRSELPAQLCIVCEKPSNVRRVLARGICQNCDYIIGTIRAGRYLDRMRCTFKNCDPRRCDVCLVAR